MPVPSSLADLSTTAASNSPAGSDAIGTSLDDYLRTTQALLKQALSKGTDIASAGTIAIPTNGNYCVVTGTTTITTISDSWVGRQVTLEFSGALTLTHSASLILFGGVNITTAAGDSAIFVNESTGVWRCVNYQRYLGNEASAGPSGSQLSMRNKIINGAFLVDQRNAYAAQTITAAAALAYTADRWYAYCTGANVTGQVVAGSNQSQKRYRFTGAASVTAIGFGTRLEAVNTYDLNNKTVTIAADLANSLLTSVTWTLYRATTTDDTFGTLASPTVTQIATGTFTVNSTVTRYSTQVSVPAAATTGLQLVFTVGAQTSGTWTIGNVQLEEGSIATPFEQRPIGLELSLCQRYYQVFDFISNSYASAVSQDYYNQLNFPVQMRIAPSITKTSGTYINATDPIASPFTASTAYGTAAYVRSSAAGRVYGGWTGWASAEL